MAARGREQQWHRSPSLWLCSEDLSSYSLRETFGSETPSGTFGVLFAPCIWLSKQLEHRVDIPRLHIHPAILQVSEPLGRKSQTFSNLPPCAQRKALATQQLFSN